MDKNLPSEWQDHVTELQIRLAHMEQDIDSLNRVITKQDKMLHELQQQLKLVYAQIQDGQHSANSSFNAVNERPPHY